MTGGRALFTSIPKCGKNLLTSLFDAFGLSRRDGPDAAVASGYSMASWTARARANGRRLQPGIDDDVLDRHLLEVAPVFHRFLGALPDVADGHYIHAHFAFDEELLRAARAANLPIVFLYRDPRATLASHAHFLVERGEPADLLRSLPSRDFPNAYRLLIEGNPITLSRGEIFGAYEGWLSAPGVLAVSFEDLIGPRGGGSASVQIATVGRIAQHIGWSGPSRSLPTLAERVFNPRVGTFRRGSIDGWRSDIPDDIITRYPEYFVDLPRRWGYGGDEPPVATCSGAFSSVDAEVAADGTRALRLALARAQAEGDERLLLVHQLETHIRDLSAAHDRVSADSDERLRLVRQFEVRVAELATERDRLSNDSDERLALIEELAARSGALQEERDRLSADSDERLALILRLVEQNRMLQEERDRVSADGDERLTLLHRLNEQLRQVTAERDQLRAESDERLAVVRRLEAHIAGQSPARS